MSQRRSLTGRKKSSTTTATGSTSSSTNVTDKDTLSTVGPTTSNIESGQTGIVGTDDGKARTTDNGGGGGGGNGGGGGGGGGDGSTVSYSTADQDDENNGQVASSTFHTSFTSNYVAFTGCYAKDGSVSSAGSLNSVFFRPGSNPALSAEITANLKIFFGPKHTGSGNNATIAATNNNNNNAMTLSHTQTPSISTTPTIVGGGGSRNMTFKSPHQMQPDNCFAQLKRTWVDQNIVDYLVVCIFFSTNKSVLTDITIYDVYNAVRAHRWKELYKEMTLQIYCRIVSCHPPYLSAVEKTRTEIAFDRLYPYISQCHQQEVVAKTSASKRINSQYVWYRIYAMTGVYHMLKFIRLGDAESVDYMKRIFDNAVEMWTNATTTIRQSTISNDNNNETNALQRWQPPVQKSEICPILHTVRQMHGESDITSNNNKSVVFVFDNDNTRRLHHLIYDGSIEISVVELRAAFNLKLFSSSSTIGISKTNNNTKSKQTDDDDNNDQQNMTTSSTIEKRPRGRPKKTDAAKRAYLPVKPIAFQSKHNLF